MTYNTDFKRDRTYIWRIRMSCAGGDYSEWSTVSRFNLSGQSGNTSAMLRTQKTNLTFNIYPNPASNLVIVEVPAPELKEAQLSLIDLTGKVIIRQKVYAGNTKVQLEVSDLPKGLYFVKYENYDEPAVKRLVIQ